PRRGPGARRDPGVRPHDVPRPGPDAGAPVHRRRPRPRGPARFSGGSAVTHAAPPPADKVALPGPRAVGKSTLGRALAARLGWRFVDTDDEVGTRVGCPAGAFLAARGEAAFRAVEAEVAVAALAPGPRAVVALGGGAVTLAAVRAALRRPGVVAVELRAPIEVLVERQARDPRPKLTDLPLA